MGTLLAEIAHDRQGWLLWCTRGAIAVTLQPQSDILYAQVPSYKITR